MTYLSRQTSTRTPSRRYAARWAPRRSSVSFCAVAALLIGACANDGGTSNENPVPPGPPKEKGQTEFVSALSEGEATRNAGASPQAAESADEDASAGPSSPERAITEADIVHLDGDTLYALSQYSGLTLVDVGNPEALRTLGHAPSSGTPFEMYVRDGVVISLINAYGHYEYDAETQQTNWVETSRVLVLDASNPSSIKELGELSVPGAISDSRLVGDVLYLVTTEYGCWRCSDGPSTVVTSFDLKDLTAIQEVDQLRFEEPEDTYIGNRSITVTPERIYIGGRNWSWPQTSEGSVIQVVDISDPDGDIATGQALTIAGQIDSRWQMDEHEGTLRVLSQWEEWRTESPPALETYQVNSSNDIVKLASLEVTLPRPEILQSVRFDGDRAYAITFEQTDPLFTFDLSDPASPKQMGELEIPGWVYHMEPRGNRIYAIGFDNGNETGALHVSLFDVRDLSNPKMMERVNFGGDWGSFAEDQDRVHKSFKLFDEAGLIVVPFSGWDWDNDGCNSSYNSGIQLVDFTSDTLTLRGVAPQIGEARRAFIHKGHLFGVSDDAVQSFDIDDRDDIKKVDTLQTASNVQTVRIVGDKVLRFGTDWWTERTLLDVASLSTVTDAQSQNALDLAPFLNDNPDECASGAYWGNVYVVGNYAYVERHAYSYVNDRSNRYLTFLVVDLSTSKPEIVNELNIELGPERDNSYRYFSGVVQTDSALLVGITEYNYGSTQSTTKTSYQVIDTRDAVHPEVVSTLEVPETLVRQGWGRFVMGCGVDMGWGWGGWYGYGYGYGYGDRTTALVSGDIVVSSHAESLEGDATHGRYYLDRFDFSDPAHPTLLEKVNIPGRAVHFDADKGRLLTIEDTPERVALGQDECWRQNGKEPNLRWNYADGDRGYCERRHQSMHQLNVTDDVAELIASAPLDGGDWYLDSTAVTSERVFIKQFKTKQVSEEYDGQTYEYWTRGAFRVQVLDAQLEHLTDFNDNSSSGWGQVRARGSRAFTSEQGTLRVFDASNPDNPQVYDRELLGYGCNSLEVRGDSAVCAQGKKGVELIPLD